MSLPKSLTNYRQFLPSTHPRCKTQKHCNRKNFACNVASLLTTPHSGYHFDSTGRRFFEGWYFKVRVKCACRTRRAKYKAKVTCASLECKRVWLLHASFSQSAKFIEKPCSLQVTLPGEGNAFALIYSIEDPAGGSPNGGVGAQVRRSCMRQPTAVATLSPPKKDLVQHSPGSARRSSATVAPAPYVTMQRFPLRPA